MPIEGRPVFISDGKTQRPNLSKILPSDRIAFSRQLELLEAWATDGATVMNNEAIARRVGLNASTVSLANPFFASVGFLNRAIGGYVASPELLEFTNGSNGDLTTLAPLLSKSWFAKALSCKLPIEEQSAIDTLAEAAALPPGRDRRGQLMLLLDYLEAAGIIGRKDSEVREGTAATRPGSSQSAPGDGTDQTQSVTVTTTFSHPGGTLEFKAVFPLATLQAKLAAHLETVRAAVERNFPVQDVQPLRRETPPQPLPPKAREAPTPQISPVSRANDLFLPVDKALSVLGMGKRSLEYMVKGGKIRTQPGPGRQLYSREDLSRLAQMRRECRNTKDFLSGILPTSTP
jgi:hypothetical protein